MIEKTDADGIVDALTRLSCEVGIPKLVLCDKQSSIEKALKEACVEMRDLGDKLTVEYGIQFISCPVAGHNFHGQVERCVRSVRDVLADSHAFDRSLHATGLQTVMKLIENQLNNVPLGYAFGRDGDNSSVLRIITPSMLRHGRNNVRALDGPIHLTGGIDKMLEKVEKTYAAWFQIWRDTWIPKLMRAPKWYKSSSDLEIGDLVYFQRSANELGAKYGRWVVGKVADVERSSDHVIRRVWITYRNAGEEILQKTERSIRSLIKIFSLGDSSIQEDLGEVQKMLKDLEKNGDIVLNKEDSADYVNLWCVQGPLPSGFCSGSHSCLSSVRDYMGDLLEGDLEACDGYWSYQDDAYYGDFFEETCESLLEAISKIGN